MEIDDIDDFENMKKENDKIRKQIQEIKEEKMDGTPDLESNKSKSDSDEESSVKKPKKKV